MASGARTAIVTGGSAGIGKGLALRLAASGLDVLICGRREAPLAEVAALSSNIRTCVADVSTEEGCAAIKAALGEAPLHLLVHNAGVNLISSLGSLDRAHFRATCAVNVEAPIFLTQTLTSNLKTAGGDARVLIVSSGAGDQPLPTMGGYCITKAAVKMAWKCLRDELADVAAVGYCKPGLVESELTGQMLQTDGFALKDYIAARTSAGDIHTAEEIGEWMEALLDGARCPADTFKSREHDVDNKEHQLGVQVRLTSEGKMLQASAEN